MTTPSYRIGAAARLSADVLVIGSGAGGATVAETMSAAGRSVIILEEGPFVPADQAPGEMSEAFLRLWRGAGLTVALGRPPISYAEGRCVGGSTEINSAIFQRAPEAALEEAARQYRIEGFGPAALAPHYDWSAATLTAGQAPPPLGQASEVLRRGAAAMGWSVKELERAHRPEDDPCLLSAGGDRQSMTRRLLPGILGRNVRLIAECRVAKLRLKGGRVVGVDAAATDVQGRRHRVSVEAGLIFLCAGAIHTPALLQASGIHRNVGDRLGMHPTIRALAAFDERIDAQRSRLPLYAVTEFMPVQRIGGSIFTPATFGMALSENWDARRGMIGDFRNAGIYYGMIRPEGRGSVRKLPSLGDPLVRYSLTDADRARIGDILDKLIDLLFAAGAKAVHPGIAGHPGIRRDAHRPGQAGGWGDLKRAGLMTIHLFGTCPPGEDAGRTATDSFGRVWGVENLIVADASQIPDPIGVNPQATVMAMARRNAEAALQGDGRMTRA